MDLSIVTISTNEGHFIGPCLRSLWSTAGQLALEVFVVDNCSTDRSAEIARASFPGVQVIRNQTRRGFSANNNAAIRLSRGRYILVINPDTVFHQGALETLVAFMDAHPEVGICGPQLRFPDGSIQPSCRRFPTWRSVLARRTPLRRFLWNSSLNANHLMLQTDYTPHDEPILYSCEYHLPDAFDFIVVRRGPRKSENAASASTESRE